MKENSFNLIKENVEYERRKEQELLTRLAKKMMRTAGQIKDFIESISSNK